MTEPRHDRAADDTAAKDTGDSAQLPAGASTLTSEVLDLLTALRDALDVPRSVWTDTDERARAELLHVRGFSARIALSSILDRGADLPGVTERLAERTADSPVEYTVLVRPEDRPNGGEPA